MQEFEALIGNDGTPHTPLEYASGSASTGGRREEGTTEKEFHILMITVVWAATDFFTAGTCGQN